jgi:hypothetical protein
VLFRLLVPAIVLALYTVAWGWTALGRGVPGGDDHPGQLYRLVHAITLGPAPWHWNAGWWAGYPELQYYPPGLFYLGALVHHVALGFLSAEAIYLGLVWLVFLLPGASSYFLLSRLLGAGWLALPGAFLALTISAESRSGIEEGLRWGLVAARLGWGLLPLLALSLLPWLEGTGRPRARPALLVAAVILSHPAHLPAALLLVLLAGLCAPGGWRAWWREGAWVVGAGLGIAAFWLLPLMVHLMVGPPMALPLAWGDASLSALASGFARRPLLLVLLAANVAGVVGLALGTRPPPRLLWLQGLVPALLLVTVADAILGERAGVLWLPADRLVDACLLALILGGSAAIAGLVQAGIAHYRWNPPWAAAGIAVVLGLAPGVFLAGAPPGSHEPSVSLWPRPRDWPTSHEVIRGNRMEALWDLLGQAPRGRVLFLRSSVPLEFGRDWWRAHSHLTSLTPVVAGREILGGTFTHPSPVAGFFYRGLADGPTALTAPVRTLAERLDGVSVFGRELARQRPGEFSGLAARLRVTTVVALEEDTPNLGFLTSDPEWGVPARVGPFLVFMSAAPRPLPEKVGPDRYVTFIPSPAGGWESTGIAWSPLWRARTPDGSVATRQGELGLLEVELPKGPGAELVLHHRPGMAEWVGALASLAALAVLGLGRRRTATA